MAEVETPPLSLNDPYAQFELTAFLGTVAKSIVEGVAEANTRSRFVNAAAPTYDARSIALPQDEAVLILPEHAGRKKFHIKAAGGTILIGKLSDLTSNSGWLLGTSGTEFETIDEVYAKAVGAQGTVYLWAEYTVQ